MNKMKIYTGQNATEFLDFSIVSNPQRIKAIVENLYSNETFAFGIYFNEKPIGFITAFKRNENNWHFAPPVILKGYENKIYEKKLLMACIQEIKQKNADSVFLRYMEKDSNINPLLDILTSIGFKPSGYSRKVFIIPKTEIEKFKMMVDRKYARFLKMHDDKVIKPFCKLTQKEIEQLKAQKSVHYPEHFDPFLMDDIDLSLSRIIYKKADPAAWVTYRVMGTSAMYVDRFYIKERYRFHGLFFPLFYDTYIQTPEQINKLVLYINGENQKMLRLFRIFKDCEKTEDTTLEMVKAIKTKQV